MPTYSYACTACEHRFDTVQTFTDTSLTDCPECTGRLRKLFSSVGIVFKGSGFYRTDSRSAPPTESGNGDKPQTDSESKPKSEQTKSEKSSSESGTASNSKPGSATSSTPPSTRGGSGSSSSTSTSASAAAS